MNNQQNPTGWVDPQQRVAPQTPPPLPPTVPAPRPPQPQQTPGSTQVQAVTRQPTGSRIAGLVALAVLAGGLGGGVAGFAAAQYLAPASSGIQTQVLQADPSNPDWAAVAQAASPAVVAIQVAGQGGQSEGSGVVINTQGYIVTNNHVVSGTGNQSQLRVTLDNTSYAATVVGTDPTTDLAVIQLVDPPSDLVIMGFADSDELVVGEAVMAIGNPLGLEDSVTTGIVSALNRPVTTQAVTDQPAGAASSDDLVVTAAIQTNAAINPGNSGGALINSTGDLVGITSSIATVSGSEASGNIGIGFAIPANQVRYVAEQLIQTGTAQHPQIGVSARDISALGQRGAEIASVVEGSPAAEAGLQVGDMITAVNGIPVPGTEALVAQVRSGEVGKQMSFTVVRDGQAQEVTLTPIAATR